MSFINWLCLGMCIKLCLALEGNDSLRLKQMEKTLADILNRLEQKETRIKILEDTLSSLEEKVASQDEIINILREENKHIVKKGVLVETEDNSTSGEKSTIKNQKNSSSSKEARASRFRRAENENPVAFLAALTGHTEHVGANQNIAFDKVFTNVGNAYNPHGGLFIAPVPGIYVFATTLFAYPNTAAHYYILKNGSLVTRMYHPDTHDTTSMTVVLELDTGDDVSVSNVDSDKTIYGALYCSFSGFLLQQYYQSESSAIGK